MHAPDYSNMSVEQVNRNLKSSQQKDGAIAKSMQYVFHIIYRFIMFQNTCQHQGLYFPSELIFFIIGWSLIGNAK